MSSKNFSEMCEEAAERLYLEHHGTKGMKWGERRWQNEDGSLTPAGREHYGYGTERGRKAADKLAKDLNKLNRAYGIDDEHKAKREIRKSESRVSKGFALNAAAAEAKVKVAEFDKVNTQKRELEEKVMNDKKLSKTLETMVAEKRARDRAKAEGFSKDKERIAELIEEYKTDSPIGDDFIRPVAFDMYSKSNLPGAAEYRESTKAVERARKEITKTAEKTVREFMGDYSDMKLANIHLPNNADGRLATVASVLTNYAVYDAVVMFNREKREQEEDRYN